MRKPLDPCHGNQSPKTQPNREPGGKAPESERHGWMFWFQYLLPGFSLEEFFGPPGPRFPICITVCLFHGVPEGKRGNFTSAWVTGPTQWVTAVTDPRWESGVCVGSGLFHRKACETLSWALCWTQSLSLPRAASLSHSAPRRRPRAVRPVPVSAESTFQNIF